MGNIEKNYKNDIENETWKQFFFLEESPLSAVRVLPRTVKKRPATDGAFSAATDQSFKVAVD